jgi:hypothetical protein
MPPLVPPPRGPSLREEDRRTAGDRALGDSVALLTAALCALTGVIHVGVTVSDLQQSSSYTPLVAMIAAFQLGWPVLLLLRPSRGALIGGAGVNAAFVVLWVLSRTVGIPVGPHPWVAEPVGVADTIAAGAEGAIVIAAACLLLARRSAIAAGALARMAPLLASVMFFSVLYGVGGGVRAGGSVWICC